VRAPLWAVGTIAIATMTVEVQPIVIVIIIGTLRCLSPLVASLISMVVAPFTAFVAVQISVLISRPTLLLVASNLAVLKIWVSWLLRFRRLHLLALQIVIHFLESRASHGRITTYGPDRR
jgi:hypothetical protein